MMQLEMLIFGDGYLVVMCGGGLDLDISLQMLTTQSKNYYNMLSTV